MLRAASPAPALNMGAIGITGGTINGASVGQSAPAAGSFTTLASSGVSAIKGSITNDSAAAGIVGEVMAVTVASGSAVALSSATGANVATISVTAGDWEISAQTDFVLSGVTATLFQSGISIVSGTLPTQAGGSGLGTDALANVPLLTTALSATYGQQAGPVRVSVNATTPVYLVAQGTFSVGTLAAYGTLRARRIR